MKNLPRVSDEKADELIEFNVVGLAKNTLWIMNLSTFWSIFCDLEN